MAVAYETIIKYLDAINKKGNLSAEDAPHGLFWKDDAGNNLPLDVFKNLSITIPGSNVKIFDETHPDQSPLYLILQGSWNGHPQMPLTGPFITDAGYTVEVDGTAVQGSQIRSDLLAWLKQVFPAAPTA